MTEALFSRPRRSDGFTIVVLDFENALLLAANLRSAGSDELLQHIRLCVARMLTEDDVVQRLSADQFLIFLSRLIPDEEAAVLADRFGEAICGPCTLQGETTLLTASVAVEAFPSEREDIPSHVRQAAVAIHHLQRRGRGECRMPGADAPLKARTRRQRPPGLRYAIEQHELSIHYQPQYEIRGGRSCGIEALARCVRSDGESMPPARFIRQAEQTGQITALGAWILYEACKTAAGWSGLAQPPILCVNVSSHQICEEFTAILAATLERTAFPAERLELEITEGILIKNPESTLDCLAQWKRLGVRIALDDFGAGSSSLRDLSRLPVDRLKIDRSLIQRMTTDDDTAASVRAAIRGGTEFGFAVVAEGVETEGQFDLLAAMRCSQVQGYLLARPVDASEAPLLLQRKWGARRSTQAPPSSHATVNSHVL